MRAAPRTEHLLETRACVVCRKPFQTSAQDAFDTCSPDCSAAEYGEADLDLVEDLEDQDLEDLAEEDEEE